MPTIEQLAGFCLDCHQHATLERDAERQRAPWLCSVCGSAFVTENSPGVGGENSSCVAPYQPWPGAEATRPYTPGPAWLVLAAAAALAASAFLPWLQAQSGIFSISRNGIENGATDGWYGIIVGALLATWEIAHLSQRASTGRAVPLVQALLALGGGAVALYDIQDIGHRVELLNANAYSTANVGPGTYLMLVACAVVLVGSVWRARAGC